VREAYKVYMPFLCFALIYHHPTNANYLICYYKNAFHIWKKKRREGGGHKIKRGDARKEVVCFTHTKGIDRMKIYFYLSFFYLFIILIGNGRFF
jgi:hypothetical protein